MRGVDVGYRVSGLGEGGRFITDNIPQDNCQGLLDSSKLNIKKTQVLSAEL